MTVRGGGVESGLQGAHKGRYTVSLLGREPGRLTGASQKRLERVVEDVVWKSWIAAPSDEAWLCQLAEAGLLRASFVPPKPIRALRNLTRCRKAQIQERAREANRLHKVLEDTGIKLDCMATDVLGVSGRGMLDALIAGTTDPAVLAELARGRLRTKLPALREALEGRFDALHGTWIGAILDHVDFLRRADRAALAGDRGADPPFGAGR
jgi:hypothetical protein